MQNEKNIISHRVNVLEIEKELTQKVNKVHERSFKYKLESKTNEIGDRRAHCNVNQMTPGRIRLVDHLDPHGLI